MRQAYTTILILMVSIFVAFGLIISLANNDGLIYALTQGAFISLFAGCCLYIYFRLVERSHRKRQTGQNLTLKVMILWRTLFWIGIFVLLLGIGMSSVSNQDFVVAGFATVFFGFALMAIGVWISQGRLIHKSNDVAL